MTKHLPDISEWRVHLIRLTAFPVASTAPDTVDGKQWWTQLTNSEPESTTIKKMAQTCAGSYENTILQLQINPVFIQWIRIPQIDPTNLNDDFPNLGSLPEVFDNFGNLMETWLVESPPLKRLALGAVLQQPVKNQETGYKRLNNYLPFVKLDPKTSDSTSDFGFSINRRREATCGIKGLKINRLMKWTLLQWEFGIQINQTEDSPQNISSVSGIACQLELDINSSPETEKIPPKQAVPLWREFIKLACEIASKGDQP